VAATTTAVCTVNVSETFTTALAPGSPATTNHVDGTGDSTGCSGSPGATVTFSWSSDTIGGTTCSGPFAAPSGGGPSTVTTSLGTTAVNAGGAGSTAAQAWSFVDKSSNAGAEAVAALAWTNSMEVQQCAMGSIATIHLTGVLLIVY
jgi:hypothetical protein